jgi:quercetin dioxygenase-like cupin family protein
LAAHEQDEISVILSGSFVLHGETGDIQCEAGDVIHIPAGEAHASTAVGDSSVFYVLYG